MIYSGKRVIMSSVLLLCRLCNYRGIITEMRGQYWSPGLQSPDSLSVHQLTLAPAFSGSDTPSQPCQKVTRARELHWNKMNFTFGACTIWCFYAICQSLCFRVIFYYDDYDLCFLLSYLIRRRHRVSQWLQTAGLSLQTERHCPRITADCRQWREYSVKSVMT